MKPDLVKAEMMRSKPDPKSVKEVIGFTGIIGYHSNLISVLFLIINLTILIKSRQISSQKSLDPLKDTLTVMPLLVYPDTHKTMVLYTNARYTVLGHA